jgi:hypothetical protein
MIDRAPALFYLLHIRMEKGGKHDTLLLWRLFQALYLKAREADM